MPDTDVVRVTVVCCVWFGTVTATGAVVVVVVVGGGGGGAETTWDSGSVAQPTKNTKDVRAKMAEDRKATVDGLICGFMGLNLAAETICRYREI